ncbi:MAG: cation transporter [Oscillospiraceae bacterium]
MKKVFEIEDLDCASCAAKIEDAIKKIDGVDFVNVNFVMQNVTLEAADDRWTDIVKQAKKIVKKVEPDATLRA